MKRILLISLALIFFSACNKEEEKINTEALPSPVDLFQGEYKKDTKEISLTWRYGAASDISHFEFYYSPGQDSLENLSPYSSSYTLYPASSNTHYLFNIRVVDLYGTHSEARVLYISTETK